MPDKETLIVARRTFENNILEFNTLLTENSNRIPQKELQLYRQALKDYYDLYQDIFRG